MVLGSSYLEFCFGLGFAQDSFPNKCLILSVLLPLSWYYILIGIGLNEDTFRNELYGDLIIGESLYDKSFRDCAGEFLIEFLGEFLLECVGEWLKGLLTDKIWYLFYTKNSSYYVFGFW